MVSEDDGSRIGDLVWSASVCVCVWQRGTEGGSWLLPADIPVQSKD